MTALERARQIADNVYPENHPGRKWAEQLSDAIHSAIIEHEAQTRAVIREFVEANRAMSEPIGSDDDLERRLARWRFALEALEALKALEVRDA